MHFDVIIQNGRILGWMLLASLTLCWSCAAETSDAFATDGSQSSSLECHGSHLVAAVTTPPHFTEITVEKKRFGVEDEELLHSTSWHPGTPTNNPELCTPYVMAWQQNNDCALSNGRNNIYRTDFLMYWSIMRFDTHHSSTLESIETCLATAEAKSCQIGDAVAASALSIQQKPILAFGNWSIGDALPVNIPGGGIAGRYYYSEDFSGVIDLTSFADTHIQFPCEEMDYRELAFELTVYAEPLYVINGQLYTQPSLVSAATLRIEQELRVQGVPLRQAEGEECVYKDMVFRTDIDSPSSYMPMPVRAPAWEGFIMGQAPIKDGKGLEELQNTMCSQLEPEQDAPPPAACTLPLTDAQRSQCTANPADCNALVCAWGDAGCQDACNDGAKRTELCCVGYQEGT